jgi:hypothetical protein
MTGRIMVDRGIEIGSVGIVRDDVGVIARSGLLHEQICAGLHHAEARKQGDQKANEELSLHDFRRHSKIDALCPSKATKRVTVCPE